MDDLTIEELKQLVVFYKQKCSDLEYEFLKNQLLVKRINSLVPQTTKNKKSE